METRAHYVAVGGFVVTVIFLAFVAVLWLGRTQFSSQYARYDIYFAGVVSGLSVGAPVQYAGIPVGHVAAVQVDPNNSEQIQVEIEVESKAAQQIKTDATAGIDTNILSGVSTIQIRGGSKDAPPLIAGEGQYYPVIRSRRNNLEQVYAKAPKLLERLNEISDDLLKILDEPNRQAITETLENLRVASASFAEGGKMFGPLTDDARTTLQSVSTLVGNLDHSYSDHDGLKDKAAAALTDFDHLAKGLNDSNRSLQTILQDARPGVRDLTQHTVGNLNDLLLEARQLVSGLTRLAAEIERDPTRIIYGDRREGYKPR